MVYLNRSLEELKLILDVLLNDNENECVEFKQAKNSFDTDKLGKYFSAISNEAVLRNRQCGWIVFGIEIGRAHV